MNTNIKKLIEKLELIREEKRSQLEEINSGFDGITLRGSIEGINVVLYDLYDMQFTATTVNVQELIYAIELHIGDYSDYRDDAVEENDTPKMFRYNGAIQGLKQIVVGLTEMLN